MGLIWPGSIAGFGETLSGAETVFLTMIPLLASAFPLTPSGAEGLGYYAFQLPARGRRRLTPGRVHNRGQSLYRLLASYRLGPAGLGSGGKTGFPRPA